MTSYCCMSSSIDRWWSIICFCIHDRFHHFHQNDAFWWMYDNTINHIYKHNPFKWGVHTYTVLPVLLVFDHFWHDACHPYIAKCMKTCTCIYRALRGLYDSILLLHAIPITCHWSVLAVFGRFWSILLDFDHFWGGPWTSKTWSGGIQTCLQGPYTVGGTVLGPCQGGPGTCPGGSPGHQKWG